MKKWRLLSFLLCSLLIISGCVSLPKKGDATNVTLTCVTSFSCTQWSNCTNGVQTRICSDESGCKNSSDAPAMNQTCDIQLQRQTPNSNLLPKIKSANTGENYLQKGEIVSYKNKIIKIDKISDTGAMINMSGQIITLRMNQPKSVDGVTFNLVVTFDTNSATIEFS